MTCERDHGPAMNRGKIGIEQLQAVSAQQNVERGEVIVQKVFVINLVERPILHNALHIQELNNEYSIGFQQFANAFRDGMQFLQMEEDACGIDHIEFSSETMG